MKKLLLAVTVSIASVSVSASACQTQVADSATLEFVNAQISRTMNCYLTNGAQEIVLLTLGQESTRCGPGEISLSFVIAGDNRAGDGMGDQRVHSVAAVQLEDGLLKVIESADRIYKCQAR
jgi:hypothetical protein